MELLPLQLVNCENEAQNFEAYKDYCQGQYGKDQGKLYEDFLKNKDNLPCEPKNPFVLEIWRSNILQ